MDTSLDPASKASIAPRRVAARSTEYETSASPRRRNIRATKEAVEEEEDRQSVLSSVIHSLVPKSKQVEEERTMRPSITLPQKKYKPHASLL
jgi:hypothetical protein